MFTQLDYPVTIIRYSAAQGPKGDYLWVKLKFVLTKFLNIIIFYIYNDLVSMKDDRPKDGPFTNTSNEENFNLSLYIE